MILKVFACLDRLCQESEVTEVVKSVKVKGYNKTHTFDVTVTQIAGHTFYQVNKNGNKVVNCTPAEFKKLCALFSGV